VTTCHTVCFRTINQFNDLRVFSPFGCYGEGRCEPSENSIEYRVNQDSVGTVGKLAYMVMPKSHLTDLLARWKPKPEDSRRNEPATEKEYETSLLAFLQKELPGLRVYSQGGKGLQKADIVIERGTAKDVIEVKKGLSSNNTYQRLVGQIQDYCRVQEGKVFVVICGDDLDPKYAEALKHMYKPQSDKIGIFHKRGKKGVTTIV